MKISAKVNRRIDLLVGLVAFAEFCFLLLNRPNTGMFLVGLLSVGLVPGWTLLGGFAQLEAVLKVSLTLPLSWSLVLLVSQAALTLHLWSPRSTLMVLMALCTIILQFRGLRRRSDA